MLSRFRDIRRATDLEAGLAGYKDWLENRHLTSKRKTGGSVGEARKTVINYIAPFAMESFANGTSYRVRRSIESNIRLGTINNRIISNNPDNSGEFFSFKKGQSPCRVYLFESNGNRSYVQSKITKLWYLKYSGESYSSPIGKKTLNEKQADAVLDAFTYLREISAGKDYVRVWSKPEDLIAARA